MTLALFHANSYLREFDAIVVQSDAGQRGVVLDRTAFYPAGGGQPSDLGELHVDGRRLSVAKVKRIGPLVWHFLDDVPPPVETRVQGVLDWDRRYALMRTHTALHILCGVVWRDYGAQVTGGNMEPWRGRLDFELDRMNTELAREIETKVNHEVDAARDVRVKVLPREEAFTIPDLIRTKINLLPEGIREVRTVEIVGLDLQADGGTHVANTKEVGRIEVAGHKSKGKINKRIVIALKQGEGS